MFFDKEGIGTSEKIRNDEGFFGEHINTSNLSWGSRGNPPFYDEVSRRIQGHTIETKQELIDFVKDIHYQITGEEMTEESVVYCKQYANGEGMSDGIITGQAWLEKGGWIDCLAEKYNLK